MVRIITALVSVVFLIGCGGAGEAGRRGNEEGRRAGADSALAPAPAAGSAQPILLFVGTSLTAGLGVAPDEAYPALIRRRIDSLGLR